MKHLLKIISSGAMIAFGTGGFAQDTNTATDGDFPVGTTPEVQVGQTYLVKQYEDWQHLCVKAEDGNDPCHIFQSIGDDSGNSIAEVNLFKLPDGNLAIAGATIITPLGTLLTAQLLFSVDEAAPKAYPFNWCEQMGCVSRVGFTGPELDTLKSGSNAQMTIRSIAKPGETVDIPVSLKGFTAAYEAATGK